MAGDKLLVLILSVKDQMRDCFVERLRNKIFKIQFGFAKLGLNAYCLEYSVVSGSSGIVMLHVQPSFVRRLYRNFISMAKHVIFKSTILVSSPSPARMRKIPQVELMSATPKWIDGLTLFKAKN